MTTTTPVISTSDTCVVVAIGARLDQRSQASRRAAVRRAMFDARAWIDAGLNGGAPLDEAVVSAILALGPAHREVLRSALA